MGGLEFEVDEEYQKQEKQREEMIDRSLQASNEEFNKLHQEQIKESDVKVDTNDRVAKAARALKDAKSAYDQSGVPATAEDYRALAITFLIDEGKTGRMSSYKPIENKQQQAPVAPAQPDKVKFMENVPVTAKINNILGEETNKFGGVTTTFGTDIGLIKTSGKLANALKASIGKSAIITMSKNDKYTNYSCVVDGVELITRGK